VAGLGSGLASELKESKVTVEQGKRHEAAGPQPEYADADHLGFTAREEEPPDEAGGA
jgi:hypothetical protein